MFSLLNQLFQSQFRLENESGLLLDEATKKILYDGRLSNTVNIGNFFPLFLL